MKQLSLLLSITFLPLLGFAGEFDAKINKACLRHSVSLVAKLKNNVVGDLSREKSDEALKIATESCQAYFKKEFSQNPESFANNDEDIKDEENSSILDAIFTSEVKRKKGNERLKNLKH